MNIDDRLAASDVVLRYAAGIDRRDWSLFRSCFTDGCDADYGVLGRWRGGDEITEFMRAAHLNCGHTLHRITNAEFAATPGGIGARSYVDSIVMDGRNRQGLRTAGVYEDDLVRVGGAWLIDRRRFTLVLMETVSSEAPTS